MKGGKREGSGRKRSVWGKKRMVYLSDELWGILKEIGDGNVSAGLRIVLSPYWRKSALARLGHKDVDVESDEFEEQCPNCARFWALFSEDFSEYICPLCGHRKV